ncbi:MAG: hypothetical protein FWE45_01440 [Firmicutes bacterium]|nr:hypothetical protein [Bacillota bacterium]
MAYQQRERVRRNKFTINNPFFRDDMKDIKVLDPETMTDEQKAMLNKDVKHDFSFIRDKGFEKYFVFAICEYPKREKKEIVGTLVTERCFFKDYESACEYFKQIDFLRYFCFQGERGEECNTLHLQGFWNYRRPMDFDVVKRVFPSIFLDYVYKSNAEEREYCMKERTSQAEYPFFEHGEFVEERQRVDTEQFTEDVLDLSIPITVLFRKYKTLTLQSLPRIKQMRQEKLEEIYKDTVRDVHVTYIYGVTRAGKSTYLRRVLGHTPKDYAKVGKYNTTGQFDNYDMQDILVFDEFKHQLPLTEMNDYTEGEPLYLNARMTNRLAIYTKVFIISNYPLSEQYVKARQDGEQPSFDGFCERIKEIIYMPARNHYIWQKGRPTDEVIETLKSQGAKIELLPQDIKQVDITEVF